MKTPIEIKKIIVLGCCGSGKSTLARKLHEHFDLPLYDLDQLFWKSIWKSPHNEEYEARHLAVVKKPKWIIDGNYNTTLSERLKHADLVVILDLPRWQCFLGIIKRRIKHAFTFNSDPGPDGEQQVNWNFLKYVWSFHRDLLPQIMKELDSLDDEKLIYKITDRSNIDKLIATL